MNPSSGKLGSRSLAMVELPSRSNHAPKENAEHQHGRDIGVVLSRALAGHHPHKKQ